VNTELEKHAAAIDQQKGADIKELCAKLMRANKALSFEQAWEMAKKSRPGLFKSAKDVHIESRQHHPAVLSSAALRAILEKYTPSKVEAKQPKEELLLVYAQIGESAHRGLVSGDHNGILAEASHEDPNQDKITELVNKTMDLNPGMARDAATALVRQTHGDLFEDQGERDEVAEKQQKIRDEIAKMRIDDKTLTFSQAWDRLRREKPSLFEGFETP
jgi:hypothetical protein